MVLQISLKTAGQLSCSLKLLSSSLHIPFYYNIPAYEEYMSQMQKIKPLEFQCCTVDQIWSYYSLTPAFIQLALVNDLF